MAVVLSLTAAIVLSPTAAVERRHLPHLRLVPLLHRGGYCVASLAGSASGALSELVKGLDHLAGEPHLVALAVVRLDEDARSDRLVDAPARRSVAHVQLVTDMRDVHSGLGDQEAGEPLTGRSFWAPSRANQSCRRSASRSTSHRP